MSEIPVHPSPLGALAAAAAIIVGSSGATAGTPAPGAAAGPTCGPGTAGAAVAADPEEIPMTPARRGIDADGTMAVRLGDSPFGVAVTEDGSYRYHLRVSARRLPPLGAGDYVVWAATPSLERHVKLGTVEAGGSVSGTVTWNKFLVFVTAEASADVDRWSQRFVLSALSPSGRMHTMAGHGPFSGEPCLDPRQ